MRSIFGHNKTEKEHRKKGDMNQSMLMINKTSVIYSVKQKEKKKHIQQLKGRL